ncbi:MAG TPA: nucleotide sugar dehydrogenase [Alphaproteobacteria bacterium]|nr:nucleotide sugar dehydrogenase [Alphaproteobacteria bacterium]
MPTDSNERIAVIGLGYVGLPLALAFARVFPGTVGFDIDAERIEELSRGIDRTGESDAEELRSTPLILSANPARITGATFFVVTVPTPVDANRQPDLGPVKAASETVGRALAPGAVVVLESTVYPGVTEEVCGPILERMSGLKRGGDFALGYSPERINPGDREHRLETMVKVVAGEDSSTLERVARVYEAIVPAGVHRAPSIRVAEAAKVIENTQRDLNIALMNELALIFDRLGLRTADVLAAASTKWNFLRFTPGLVGGHCIGVDPYYLTAKAEAVGYHPEVILAGRRINDGVGRFVAHKLLKLLAESGRGIARARVGLLGLTFKENIPDLRNSRVPDIVSELAEFGLRPLVHDPLASGDVALREYGIALADLNDFHDLDGLVLAVPHREYLGPLRAKILGAVAQNGVFIDLKSAVWPNDLPGVRYWSL